MEDTSKLEGLTGPGRDDDDDVATRIEPSDDVSAGFDLASEAPVERGSRLDDYVVLQTLGTGAMGHVYLAYDTALARSVALKVLRPVSGAAVPAKLASLEDRVLREAQAAARLSHANVTAIYGVGVVDGVAYIAMEYVKGVDLRQWLTTANEAELAWRAVVKVFTQAGLGLQAAHEAGLLHRDFKPDNVLLSENGVAKVTDFGLAGGDDAPASISNSYATPSESERSPLVSSTGVVLGTPAYMAPEQYDGEPVDVRADLYAFSVSLYEALHGVRPFAGPDRKAVMRAKVPRLEQK